MIGVLHFSKFYIFRLANFHLRFALNGENYRSVDLHPQLRMHKSK